MKFARYLSILFIKGSRTLFHWAMSSSSHAVARVEDEEGTTMIMIFVKIHDSFISRQGETKGDLSHPDEIYEAIKLSFFSTSRTLDGTKGKSEAGKRNRQNFICMTTSPPVPSGAAHLL